MERTPMPLLDELTRPGAMLWGGGAYESTSAPVPQSTRWALNEAVRVLAPPVDGEEDRVSVDNLTSIVGPQRLPFPIMWLEWDHITDEGGYGRVGALVLDVIAAEKSLGLVNVRRNFLREGQLGYFAEFFLLKGGRPRMVGHAAAIVFDSKGEVEGLGFFTRDSNTKQYKLTPQQHHREVYPLVYGVAKAVGVLNCRNVSIEEVTRAPKRAGKKSRRPRPAGLSYHLITVTVRGRSLRLSSAGGTDKEARNAMHKVRGHFKHYTEERPLFGKISGTIYVPWHLRGDRSHGEVVGDYQIKEAADA